MFPRKTQISLTLLGCLFLFGACSQPLSNREKGTLIGGGAGAAGGALLLVE
jgi:hypothetical protein